MTENQVARPEWSRWGSGRWHALLGVQLGIAGEMTTDGPKVTGIVMQAMTLCGQTREVTDRSEVPTEDPAGGTKCSTCQAAIEAIEANVTGKVPGAFEQSTLVH